MGFFGIIIFYLVSIALIALGIYRLLKFFSRRKAGSVKNNYILLTIFLLIITISFIIYFNYRLSTMESHYDIRKGSLRWIITMNEPTINKFPIILPKSKPVYNQLGEAGPAYGIGWELTYSSAMDFNSLQKEIAGFILKEGYTLNNYNPSEENVTYRSQINKKSLDLTYFKNENETIVKAIVFE